MADGESTMEFPAEISMVKMAQYPKPMVRFFYERPDGSVVDVSEQEAAVSLKNSRKFMFYRQIGVSDGKARIAFLKNCGVKPGEMIAYDKAQKIMRDAYNAELEAARGHFRNPVLAEWAYPDGSVPLRDRQEVQLPTHE